MLALRETPASYSGGPRRLDRVRHAIRARHYSRRTEHDLPWLDDVVRARRPRHLPVMFTRDEVRRVVTHLDGAPA